MKTTITVIAFAVYTVAATVVYAGGNCNSSCAEGYTYSSETGTCVKKTVSS